MNRAEKSRQYYLNNKEHIQACNRLYKINNKEKIKITSKLWSQTPDGIKSHTISNWVARGLIETDDYTYDSLYETYLYHSNCELCDVELTKDKYHTKTTKCMDHSHETNIFRNIVCHSCNIKRH